ncbi:uncharacterized protein OCT59_012601 [Rhizophagus irregularis]|uniref:uncharacterized protein n=1 Tax=Rhizophagus irregularis TaxID=588596 RepID=UPI00332B9F89|nr:hypothetical protein OCT59_012601 [Rhizophagus irregularis]
MRKERVSSFGIVIGNRGKCEVAVCRLRLIRLINSFWSTTASVLIFGFGYIGFSFSFWVLDRAFGIIFVDWSCDSSHFLTNGKNR